MGWRAGVGNGEKLAGGEDAAMGVLRDAIAEAMKARINESPSIKSKMDDVAEAVAAVKRDLIGELPKNASCRPDRCEQPRGHGERADAGLRAALRRGLTAGGVVGQDIFPRLELRPGGTLVEITGPVCELGWHGAPCDLLRCPASSNCGGFRVVFWTEHLRDLQGSRV